MASGCARVQGAGSDKSHLADYRRVPAGLAPLVSLLVSFGYVQRRSAHTTRDRAAEAVDPLDLRWTQRRRLGKRVGDSSRSRPARERPSDELSDNRHRQRWTPADTHGWSAAGQACCGAGSPCRDLASGRRGHDAPRPRQARRVRAQSPARCLRLPPGSRRARSPPARPPAPAQSPPSARARPPWARSDRPPVPTRVPCGRGAQAPLAPFPRYPGCPLSSPTKLRTRRCPLPSLPAGRLALPPPGRTQPGPRPQSDRQPTQGLRMTFKRQGEGRFSSDGKSCSLVSAWGKRSSSPCRSARIA